MTQAYDYRQKPAIPTQPFHHFCSVIERSDIEEQMHSSTIAVHDAGIKLDGRKNRARLVQVIGIGHGRWVAGGRQPAEVELDQLVYVKERTIPFRLHLRKQNHHFIAMDSVMAELDPVNLKLRPIGQFVVTRELDQFSDGRVRKAVMGDTGLYMGQTTGIEKDGQEADDIGCNKTRIEEVVAVGPGKFGGFIQHTVDVENERLGPGTPYEGLKIHGTGRFRTAMVPYWETVDCKPGDLVVFTDMARPTSITLAGRKFTLFEFDHSVCSILDAAV